MRFLLSRHLALMFAAVGICIAGLLTTSSAFGESIVKTKIIIHPNQTIAAVTPYQLGSNLPVWLGDHLNDATFIARTASSGIQYLRIPGGSMSDNFGWLSCEKRQDQTNAYPCYQDWEQWAARPTDFINFIRATGIQNVIYTVNVNVTPQEAAAAVAFFNALPSNTTNIGVDTNGFDWKTAGYWAQLRVDDGNTAPLAIKHWELGNEIYGSTPGTGGNECQSWGWENGWTCDGADYVNGVSGHAGYTAMRNAMRAIDPSILFGAVGFETADGYSDWSNKVVTNAGSFMDFFVVHPYMYDTPPPNTLTGWAQVMAKPRQQIPVIKSALQAAFDAHAGGRAIPIVANEFNIPAVQDSDGQQMMNRAGNAFFISEMIGQFIANGFMGVNQWDLANGCAGNGTCYDLLQVDHNWKRAPQYYAFPLWSRFGNTMVAVSNNLNPETKLSVYAGKIDAGSYSVLVLNKTAQPYKGLITFDNSLVATGGTADVLSATSPIAKKVLWNGKASPSDDLSSAPAFPLTQFGATTRYVFAPYSITLLRLTVE